MSRNIPMPDGNHTHVSSSLVHPHTDSLHTCPNTYIDLHKPTKLTFCCKLCKSIYIHKQKSFQFNNCIFQRMFFRQWMLSYIYILFTTKQCPTLICRDGVSRNVTCEYTPHLFNTSRVAGWCDNSNALLGSDKERGLTGVSWVSEWLSASAE